MSAMAWLHQLTSFAVRQHVHTVNDSTAPIHFMVYVSMARSDASTPYCECSFVGPDRQMPASHERLFPPPKDPTLSGIRPRLDQRFEEPICPVVPAHHPLSQPKKSARHRRQWTRQTHPSARLRSFLL